MKVYFLLCLFLYLGTDKERGLLSWRAKSQDNAGHPENSVDVYKFPYITKILERVKCCSYIPVSPTFDKEIKSSCCKGQMDEEKKKEDESGNSGYDNHVVMEDGCVTEVDITKF